MTHLFSIALSFLILLQSVGLHLNDIVQLDELIEHSQFHSKEYGDNFFVFVSKHYGELKAEHEEENQNEKDEHEKLPFQNQSQISGISAFFLNTVKTELNTSDFLEYTASIFYYQAPSSSLYSEGPFQPPRLS